MNPAQLLVLSLGLSVAVAALGLTVMRLLERRLAHPVIRERAWGAILHLSALPPVLVAALLVLPPPVRRIDLGIVPFGTTVEVTSDLTPVPGLLVNLEAHGATFVLAIAALLLLIRCLLLISRLLRLRGLMAASTPAGPDLLTVANQIAWRLRVSPPSVRVSASGSEAFLAGLRTPVLVLPAALAAAPDSPEIHAICAHELAHLKRGDHRALWLEEAVLSALAINPLLGLVRDHRAAAREEACDATALAGADADVRRQYARSLLAALQDPAFGRGVPALTFTSARRTFVMRRLKAILAPVSSSGPRSRLVLTGLGVLIAGVAGAGSLAVAAQREPVMVARPVLVPVPAPAALPARPAAPLAAIAATPVAEPVATAITAVPVREVGATERSVPPTRAVEASIAEDITNPSWAQHPMAQFPAAALSAGLTEGRVVLTCTAEPDGRLSACSTVSETPTGAGFAASAMEASRAARLSARTIDSASPRSKVTFTIAFRVAG